MAEIFTSFILTSSMGTVLAILIMLLKPVTGKFFSAAWHYYMWLAVLLVMVLPIRLHIPEIHITESTTHIISTETNFSEIITPAKPQAVTEIPFKNQLTKDTFTDNISLLSYIWLAGIIFIFAVKIIGYYVFIRKLHANSKTVSCPEISVFTQRKTEVRKSNAICSPLVTGIFKPILVLPETELTPEQLQNILAHELTHLKRNDILYKWFVCIVKCIHWFNPAIYFISQQINTDCEISCDLSVVKHMNEQEQKSYIETILSLLTKNSLKTVPLTTGMTGNKKTLKIRFTMIKNRKTPRKATRIFSIISAIMMLSATLVTSGALAYNLLKEDIKEPISGLIVMDNEKPIELSNEPFYQQGTVYLPLEELLEKTELLSGDKPIEQSNEKVILHLTEKAATPNYDVNGNIIGENSTDLNYCYGLEAGKAEYTINPDGSPIENHSSYQQYLNVKQPMESAPAIKDDAIYIPYEYADYMINKVMQTHKITVSDTAKTDIVLSQTEAVNISENTSGVMSENNGYSSENKNVKSDVNGKITFQFASESKDYVDITFLDVKSGNPVAEYGVIPDEEKSYSFDGFDVNSSYNIILKSQSKQPSEEISYTIY